MAVAFPPKREADLVTFTGTFKATITADPSVFSLTPEQAANYGTLSDAFVAAYAVANDPATRSPMNVARKTSAKFALIQNLRLLAGIIQRAPGTTNPMRVELGLAERVVPGPVPPPAFAPKVVFMNTVGRTTTIRLIDINNPTRRGRPARTHGAAIFSYVGATAPVELTDWKFEANTGRMMFDITFPSTVPAGATVWVTAFYFSGSKARGPICDPVCTNLPGGSVSMAA